MTFDILGGNGNGNKPFPCYIQSVPQGGFLCSPEHGKLCFEHLGMISDAQNNLPFAGGRKHLPKSGFCMDFKMD